MNSWELFRLLLNQCWQVAVVGLVVLIAVRLFARSRPHLSHVLWSVVLLKAVTPPVLSTSWSPFGWLMNLSTSLTATAPVIPSASEIAPQVSSSERTTAMTNATDSIIGSNEVAQISYSPGMDGVASEFWFVLCLLWALSVGAALAISLMLYSGVVRSLKRGVTISLPELELRLDELRQNVGLRRPVKLKVINGTLGPVVLGFFQPTIVLPALLVQGKSVDTIVPLLAHELIHIRRGDLWWAVLQVIARGLFWFHPAVRWAESQLTQAAELCCDEETIRFLDCAPATYARCLLNVLEQKHRLQVAPALPGVRPLDITKDRLERVMKTGKTSSRRSPVWGWLVLLVGCGLTLPSAASVGISQDEPTENRKPMFVVRYYLIETTRQAMATDGFWKTFEWEDTGVQAERFQESIVESNRDNDNTDPESFPVPTARLDKLDSEHLKESLQKRGESDLSPTAVVKMAPIVVTELQRTATVLEECEIPVLKANRDVGVLTFGTQLMVTPDKFEDQVVTLELEFEFSELTEAKPGQGSAATGVEGIRLTTLQDLPLESFIAFEVPQPERDNEPMVVLVQCGKVVDAPTDVKPVTNRSSSLPLRPTPVVPRTAIPKFN
jgi:beta-lactamase regulating signal transducer with metallopeptidase domain